MTVAPPPVARAVIDLGTEATVLDAARRLAALEPGQDAMLVVAAGAPLARNAVFFDVLRRRAEGRRLIVVSSDARARSLAASVHLRTFASLAALDRHELDATEHLGEARRTALATIAATKPRTAQSAGRGIAAGMSLLGAAAIVLAVIAPAATVVVAPAGSPIGPFEYDLRAGPAGERAADIRAETLLTTISATVAGTATGSRAEEATAQGIERFTNRTRFDVRIPRGTIVRTPDGIRFQTTEDRTLPGSTLVPFVNGEVTISIEAVEPGPRGNVGAQRITVSPSPDYSVTNPVETLRGDSKKIPIVQQADYDAAVARSQDEMQKVADTQLKVWQSQARREDAVHGTLAKRSGITPAADIVGKEQATFELVATGTATAYTVLATEPRATAVKRLAQEVSSDKEIDGQGAVIETVIGPTVSEDGVRWRVRARGVQFARANLAQMSTALAGRPFNEVTAVARARGFQLARAVEPWPSWWPRFPALDFRITIELAPPIVASPP